MLNLGDCLQHHWQFLTFKVTGSRPADSGLVLSDSHPRRQDLCRSPVGLLEEKIVTDYCSKDGKGCLRWQYELFSDVLPIAAEHRITMCQAVLTNKA